MTFSSWMASLQDIFEKAPQLDSSSAQLLTREHYLKQFNIATADQLDNDPLGIVLMYDAEDPLAGSLWEERLEDFAELEIYQLLGVSWEQYINQPRHELMQMNATVARVKKKKLASTAAITELERQLKEAGVK